MWRLSLFGHLGTLSRRARNYYSVSSYGLLRRNNLTQRIAKVGTICSGIAAGVYLSVSPVSAADKGPEKGSEKGPEKGSEKTTHSLPSLPNLDELSSSGYNSENTTVVFVLGGPGVGKGTQCSKLVQECDFVHISAGDLLRDERQRAGSPYGELIDHYIREGKIVPYEITITLLFNKMKENPGKTRFLIDGFPRNVEQGIAFEMNVCGSKMVLFFECEEDVMMKRLMGRSQSSGRTDDNVESIKKRFRTFQESTVPVREFYNSMGKLRAINCSGSVEEVYERTKSAVHDLTKM